MRRALTRNPSLDQQQRLRRLLDQAEQTGSRIGLIVSVLAHLETSAATRLLAHWAQADPEGPLGRAAARVVKSR
jgi:hypothetical protein